jgi:hypothetical protein
MNSNVKTPPAPVTREDLKTLLDLPPEFLRESIQILATLVGPTHTDQNGRVWTDRDLHCMASGMAGIALPILNSLKAIAEIMAANADRIPVKVHEDVLRQCSVMFAAAEAAVKAKEDPHFIIMGR